MLHKIVLVTGAAKRIGAGIVRELHASGANLMLHYHTSANEAHALADELNRQRSHSVALIQANLLDFASLPLLIQRTHECFGRLDALVNNASSFFATTINDINNHNWHNLMGTNVQAPLFLAQAAAPLLRQYHGCIVNIADIHAERPMKNHIIYNIAKAGVVAMTRSLARELAPEIRVNAIAPGSNIWPESHSTFDDIAKQRIIRTIFLKRIGDPVDIARTIAFLINDAHYITGQIIAVDGGRSLYL